MTFILYKGCFLFTSEIEPDVTRFLSSPTLAKLQLLTCDGRRKKWKLFPRHSPRAQSCTDLTMGKQKESTNRCTVPCEKHMSKSQTKRKGHQTLVHMNGIVQVDAHRLNGPHFSPSSLRLLPSATQENVSNQDRLSKQTWCKQTC